ncbi:MSHA biogenesis protein MshM [Vibrio sp. 10N.286.49.B3]|uniref:ExeA family protein n=1 Tax=Vibrio sp. 10N.286.49.B3 TaxID=1880855 RepID=UPI000C82A00A|nr:AAA family ATPase [Vibrio sp. 10N.286.49.B3]PMH39893.1 MSHA biogenesis protein MshM [Vibrio sp. 10N.286.49.B3]
MYRNHFGFSRQPFSLTPNSDFFYGLAPHYEAIQTVLSALEMGEGLIKISGEVGTGKTMVCRMLVNELDAKVALIYLPNPVLSAEQLRQAVAKELAITATSDASLVDDIQAKLIDIHAQGRKAVVLVDEAQALSDETLEALRLFGNLETEQSKLLQMVLIGQPELDERLAQRHLRQFRQRITFSAQLRALSLAETVAYINHRLEIAAGSESIIPLMQKKAIWRSSRGIPRLINQLCHKALLLTFTDNQNNVDNRHLYLAISDTFDVCKPKFKTPCLWGWSQP